MNIFLWILQVLLAIHTAIGAVWKLSNSEQTVPSLSAIPHALWQSLSLIEVLCSLGLVLAAFYRPLGKLVPVAAALVLAEMLLFSVVHLASGDPNHGQLVYWLVVAALCGFIAFGRVKLSPL